MNRIDQLFEKKRNNVFSLYFCAGHPTCDSTVSIIETLANKGVDLLEIGIPFSDPMADGPTIQKATRKALQNGMSLKLLFEQLKDIRKKVSIPLVLMGYLNPIVRFGFENFCQACAQCGIDGMIVPDLPPEVYEKQYKEIAERYGVRLIMLITPMSTEERIHKIDRLSGGFIYMVSSAAVTGAQNSFGEQTLEYFRRINQMDLRSPRMIGFGISNRQTLETARAYSAGTIIGSQFIKLLEECPDVESAYESLQKMLNE